MKVRLIKIMSKFDTPLKETITALFPRELEETLKKNYILVSDDKYRTLRFNHVEMYTYAMIDITSIHKIINNFDYKEYYIIKEIVELGKDEVKENLKELAKTLKEKEYKIGDSILYFVKGEADLSGIIEPIPSVLPKDGKWYEATINESGEWEANENKLAKYPIDECFELYTKYETEKKDYENAIAILEYKSSKEYHILATVTPDMKLLVNADFTFETTKDCNQFGVKGKLDSSINTLVTKDVGGLKGGDSLRGLSFTDIFTKAFGLESETDLVGKIVTASNKGTVKTTVTKKSVTENETFNITSTITLPENTEATTIKLINSKTKEVIATTPATPGENTLTKENITITETTSYQVIAVHQDEKGSEIIDVAGSVVTVNLVLAPPSVTINTSPETVSNISSSITITGSVTKGSGNITKVQLYQDGVLKYTKTENFDSIEYVCNGISKNSTFKLTVTDSNNMTASASKVVTFKEVPLYIWGANYGLVPAINDYFESVDGRQDITLDYITVENVKTFMSDSWNDPDGNFWKFEAVDGEYETRIMPARNKWEENIYVVPAKIPENKVNFRSNGVNVNSSYSLHKELNIDGVDYRVYLIPSPLWDNQDEIDMWILIG